MSGSSQTSYSPRLAIPVGPDDHVQGSPSARVTLVEYGDYECPHCGRAYPVVKALQQRLGDRLLFVFRNFPLTEIHEHAEHAAEAAESAAARGKFWEMHDLLFEHQRALDDSHLLGYAGQLGLDPGVVVKEIEDEAHFDRIRSDFMGGVRSGVNGTPTFFINGVRFDRAWNDAEQFLAALEEGSTRTAGRGTWG